VKCRRDENSQNGPISLANLTFGSLISTFGAMELRLSPEQEAELAALAAQEGRTPDDLAREVFGRALAEETRFVEAVTHGLASLDRGEYVSHQELGARIERLFQA
jgi:predicted transcriptional regulator